MKKTKPPRAKESAKMRLFQVKANYAESIFQTALGNHEGSLVALKRALEWDPTCAPAILTLGSIEYQRRRPAQGRKLFQSLLSLSETTPDLFEIIDKAATFLVDFRAREDGLALFRAAAERALQLEPGNQKNVNNLGWALFEAGRFEQARTELERAVSVDSTDELARENLRLCRAEIAKRSQESGPRRKPGIAAREAAPHPPG